MHPYQGETLTFSPGKTKKAGRMHSYQGETLTFSPGGKTKKPDRCIVED